MKFCVGGGCDDGGVKVMLLSVLLGGRRCWEGVAEMGPGVCMPQVGRWLGYRECMGGSWELGWDGISYG